MKTFINRKLINVLSMSLMTIYLTACFSGSGRSPSGSRNVSGVKTSEPTLIYETELQLAYSQQGFDTLLDDISDLLKKDLQEPSDIYNMTSCPNPIKDQAEFDKFTTYNDFLLDAIIKYNKAISAVDKKSDGGKFNDADKEVLQSVADYLVEEKTLVLKNIDNCETRLGAFSGSGGNDNNVTPTPTFTPTPTPTPVPTAEIYVGTEKGLSISRDGGKTFSLKSDAQGLVSGSNGKKRINGIVVKGNMVYLAAEAGIAISSNKGDNFTTYKVGEGQFQDVLVKDSKIYGSTWRFGVYYAAPGSTSFSKIDSGLPNGSVSQTCYVDGSKEYFGEDMYLVGTDDKLAIAVINNATFQNTQNLSLIGNQIRGVFCGKEGVSYVATTNGLSIVDLFYKLGSGLVYASFNETSGLGSKELSKVFVNETHIVVATMKGVSIAEVANLSPSMTFTNFLLPTPSTNRVQGVTVDSQGYIYAVTHGDSSNMGGGLYVSTESLNSGKPFNFKKLPVPFTHGYEFKSVFVVR